MSKLYNYEKALKREEERVKNATFSKRSKDLIFKFKKQLLAEGIGKARIVRYMTTLRKVAEWHDKPFDEWESNDMLEVVAIIEECDYTIETKNEFRKGLRKFFRWLKGENWDGLKYVRGEKKNNRIPDILTEDEILQMIDAVSHPRDKALIAVGYEGGLRIGELAGLRMGDVEFLSVGGHLKAKIKVSGKTGERKLPLIMSVKYLEAWLAVHPRKDDPNAVVFCSISNRELGEPMNHQSFNRIIKTAAKKAGIKKRVYPHLLRHSRATVLAQHLTESVLCEYFGWVQGSDIPRVYVHLSGRDLDKAIDSLYGIAEENKPKVVKPKRCPRCNHINEPTAKYCSNCALILDEAERIRLEMEMAKSEQELLAMVAHNPEVAKMAMKFMVLALARNNPEVMEELLKTAKLR